MELKWTPKYSDDYLASLAPAFGESQFEYRERIKWEFAENMNLKKYIQNKINTLPAQGSFKRQHERVADSGGYCGIYCRHYVELYEENRIDADNDISYCSLGYLTAKGSFCEYFEESNY